MAPQSPHPEDEKTPLPLGRPRHALPSDPIPGFRDHLPPGLQETDPRGILRPLGEGHAGEEQEQEEENCPHR